MIKEGRRRGILSIVGMGVAATLLWQPMVASAAEGNYVLQQAGIASMFSVDLTQEEYVNIAKEAVGASWGYTNIGIANVESGNLNVRAEASTKGKLVGKMSKDAACEVLDIDKENGWAHIKSGEVEGYVSTEFLLVGPEARLRANELVEKVVIADTDGLRVRDNADVNSAVMTQILKGEELEFVEELDGFIEAHCRNIGVDCIGKEKFSCIDELMPLTVAAKLSGIGAAACGVHSGSVSHNFAVCILENTDNRLTVISCTDDGEYRQVVVGILKETNYSQERD